MKSLQVNITGPVWVFILLMNSYATYGQSIEVQWKFDTRDKVAASPVIDKNILYIGGENGVFYALNIETGEEIWRFKTRGYILGKATVFKDIVFFESSNVFYALDKVTGKEQWRYDQGWDIWGYKIDHWDDIRSEAIVYNDVFYVGTSLGEIIGLNSQTGQLVFKIAKGINAPIRTTPVIHNGNIYFGDWNGKIYCHALSSKELVWEKETVTKKYYDSFGPIVSEMLVFEDNLYFGARNPQMTVLNAETGETVWIKNENDSTGGWIVGTPVVNNNTLFIGGSDSFELYALNPEDGSEKWKYHCGLNIYTKPLITEDEVIFTAGYGYWYWENYHPKSGFLGGIFILDRNTGNLITKQEYSKPIFSSPVLKDGVIYYGSYDGQVYALSYNAK